MSRGVAKSSTRPVPIGGKLAGGMTTALPEAETHARVLELETAPATSEVRVPIEAELNKEYELVEPDRDPVPVVEPEEPPKISKSQRRRLRKEST
jgi:hypothetical protein